MNVDGMARVYLPAALSGGKNHGEDLDEAEIDQEGKACLDFGCERTSKTNWPVRSFKSSSAEDDGSYED